MHSLVFNYQRSFVSLLLGLFLIGTHLPLTHLHAAQATPMIEPGKEYGPRLKTLPQEVGPCMDVAVAEGYVFAIGKGFLHVLKEGAEAKAEKISKIGGLGNTRQIAISEGFAYITSREDGMFVVDVRRPTEPKLVAHYDTAELATAIAVSGKLAAVGNRFAGVELIDISDPANPKFLSCIRAGEVQSLVFHGTWLYAGAWSEKEVVAIDVKDPRNPVVVSHNALDGYGDGLDVQGHLLAAATGHHAPGKGRPEPGDPRYGAGHGIEFFDVSRPESPRRLSGVKFPPFYRLGMDMWGVVLSEGYAFVNDTHNGFFMYDVIQPEKPVALGWTRLPKVKEDFSPVAGIAVSHGKVYLAGASDDLHVVEASHAKPVKPSTLAPPALSPQGNSKSDSRFVTYKVEGSIRNVVPWKKDLLLVAAGSAGWHIVKQSEENFESVSSFPTTGFARDIAFHGNRIYVAESLGGLSLWEADDSGEVRKISDYKISDQSIHQVVLADEGRVAYLAVGANQLYAVHVKPNGVIEKQLGPVSILGLFYRDPFSVISPTTGTLLAQWHATGLLEFGMEKGVAKQTQWSYPHRMGTGEGVVPFKEGWIVTASGGYYFLKQGEERSPAELGVISVEGAKIFGKPWVDGSTLFVSDPFKGVVFAVDIQDINKPKLMEQLQLTGHPGRVKVNQGKALIPAGREGLLMWKLAR